MPSRYYKELIKFVVLLLLIFLSKFLGKLTLQILYLECFNYSLQQFNFIKIKAGSVGSTLTLLQAVGHISLANMTASLAKRPFACTRWLVQATPLIISLFRLFESWGKIIIYLLKRLWLYPRQFYYYTLLYSVCTSLFTPPSSTTTVPTTLIMVVLLLINVVPHLGSTHTPLTHFMRSGRSTLLLAALLLGKLPTVTVAPGAPSRFSQ